MFRKPDDQWEIRRMNIESIPYDTLPEHTQHAMREYIEKGIPIGGFFKAVLTNDLRGACNKADSQNKEHIFDYVHFLYNYAPASCWGNPERYKQWVEGKGYAGLYAETATA